MTHHLKTWPEYFQAIQLGIKPFEIRKNDRNFQPGDVLMLNEFLPVQERYTKRTLRVEVTYVFDGGGDFGVMEGYCVMGIRFAEFEG